ncbi:class I SAM-dependent methyltransferase [Kitasatospora aureofaciens]|uniref:class I SAM-dependent methyltransferase n=1 Tax=Kitasatospora aureofaciens TaxID=1894 RepID=UPI001C49689D|nr:class I SAM-dependent methyltransferase [Kitasatospora aureofaciens]MBV6698373.1 class I SAM-dependent methyltransferase [Kitasatospora aureofaciens]
MTITTAGTNTEDIAYHYDLGNDFYALWLDETLAYTAAKWDGIPRGEPDALALPRAQRAKLDHHLDLVGADPGAGLRLLDIGCGWGAMLEHASRGGRAAGITGLTISRAQHEFLTARALPGVEARLESWEDHEPARPYDAVVGMGSFEHFATAGMSRAERLGVYARYFEACHRWLRPGGRMSLQTIAYDGAADGSGPLGEFVGSDIFPNARLPRLSEIAAACDPYFSVVALTASAEDYARTLASWSARLLRAREEAERLVGAEGYRRYRRYLRGSEVTFLRGAATLYRIGFRRRDEPLRLPA